MACSRAESTGVGSLVPHGSHRTQCQRASPYQAPPQASANATGAAASANTTAWSEAIETTTTTVTMARPAASADSRTLVGIRGPPTDPCSAYSVCERVPAQGADRESCEHDANDEASGTGYCYIDASTDRNRDGARKCERLGDPDCLGDPRLVADCPDCSRRLRFASPSGSETPFPRPDGYVFGTCEFPTTFRPL